MKNLIIVLVGAIVHGIISPTLVTEKQPNNYEQSQQQNAEWSYRRGIRMMVRCFGCSVLNVCHGNRPYGDEYHAAKNAGVNYLTVAQTYLQTLPLNSHRQNTTG